MKRTKQVLITVISTQIDHRKKFIGGLSRRSWDNKYLITHHTEDQEQAREFLNEGHAHETMKKLVNHHSRTYTVETIMVNVSKRHPVFDDDEMT